MLVFTRRGRKRIIPTGRGGDLAGCGRRSKKQERRTVCRSILESSVSPLASSASLSVSIAEAQLAVPTMSRFAALLRMSSSASSGLPWVVVRRAAFRSSRAGYQRSVRTDAAAPLCPAGLAGGKKGGARKELASSSQQQPGIKGNRSLSEDSRLCCCAPASRGQQRAGRARSFPAAGLRGPPVDRRRRCLREARWLCVQPRRAERRRSCWRLCFGRAPSSEAGRTPRERPAPRRGTAGGKGR